MNSASGIVVHVSTDVVCIMASQNSPVVVHLMDSNIKCNVTVIVLYQNCVI
jgi:hypothetical protein